MNKSSALHATCPSRDNKFKGVRRRKWGKWVSEIRVPGTQERLWLGTYVTPEAAAVAHDVAVYCLRRPSSLDKLNLPDTLSSYSGQLRDMSPRSVQKVASDVGMDVDARHIAAGGSSSGVAQSPESEKKMEERNGVVGADDSDEFWWNGLEGYDSGTWKGSGEDCADRDALNISIEDYL
ncbi:ethylene-responsive transcription factor ERF020 [Vigna radiata var. radiata]|uniref:Ethylene-responsive transcription factor ERF020 n=1 Tax=Vigna radiata var. radiata TaxID=3916 RepID=A0A1S3VMF2_VIGRR|nr:ethylene-responsive transcription factor ERF020 [Vigna radiata var. radiata]